MSALTRVDMSGGRATSRRASGTFLAVTAASSFSFHCVRRVSRRVVSDACSSLSWARDSSSSETVLAEVTTARRSRRRSSRPAPMAPAGAVLPQRQVRAREQVLGDAVDRGGVDGGAALGGGVLVLLGDGRCAPPACRRAAAARRPAAARARAWRAGRCGAWSSSAGEAGRTLRSGRLGRSARGRRTWRGRAARPGRSRTLRSLAGGPRAARARRAPWGTSPAARGGPRSERPLAGRADPPQRGLGVAVVAVAPRAATLGRVGHHDVGPGLGYRDQLESFVTRVERRRGLGGHDRKDLDALHVLLDVGAIDGAHDGAARARATPWRTPLGSFAPAARQVATSPFETGDFDLNASRHRRSNLVAQSISETFRRYLDQI